MALGAVYKNLSFVYFLAAMALMYIANAHYAERNMREIQVVERELKERHWKYMSLKADLMHHSTSSEVEKSVAHLGLRVPLESAPVIDLASKVDADE